MKKEALNNIKKRVAMCAVAGILVLSGGIGASSMANAATGGNTSNSKFQFRNDKSLGYSGFRGKTNSTSVYIYPTVGPVLKYTVQGADNSSGAHVANRSNEHAVSVGVEASFYNTVRKYKNKYARLRGRRTVKAQYTDSICWWSPDSTRNYIVYH